VTDTPSTGRPSDRAGLGIILISLSVTLFGVVDGVSKFLVDQLSFGQIMLGRYAFAVPVLLLATPPGEWKNLLATRVPGQQAFRGLMPLLVGGLVVTALMFMPLAEATVILFAAPFIVLVLSGWFLGEKVDGPIWIAVVVGFLAVLLVARPGFDGLSWYAILPACAAFFYAVLLLASRRLGAAGEKPITSVAWTLLVGLVISVPLALYDWRPPTIAMWGLLLVLGLFMGGAQLLLAKAFTMAPASVLTPFTYVQILAAIIFGMLVFGDVPDVPTMIGIAMITGAGLYIFRRNS
jgi:drug/metabolite transporter (DMT)-like permease